MTPEQLAALVADKEAGTPGPWSLDILTSTDPNGDEWETDVEVSTEKDGRPLHIHSHDLGYNDDVDLAIRANARRIARVPDLEDVVIALVAERDALKAEVERLERHKAQALRDGITLIDANAKLMAEVARLSTPPDDAEVVGLVGKLTDHVSDPDCITPSPIMCSAADALTRLSHAHAAETARREALEEALRDHSLIGALLLSMQSPVLPPDLRDRLDTVRAEARATLAKHGSK